MNENLRGWPRNRRARLGTVATISLCGAIPLGRRMTPGMPFFDGMASLFVAPPDSFGMASNSTPGDTKFDCGDSPDIPQLFPSCGNEVRIRTAIRTLHAAWGQLAGVAGGRYAPLAIEDQVQSATVAQAS